MSGRALAAVAATTLLFLAGCGGVFGGPSGPDRQPFDAPEPTATGTDTPAPPTATTTDSVFDAADTVEEHLLAIGQSATVRQERVVRFSNGTVRYGRTRTVFVDAVGGYYRRQRINGTVGAFGGVNGTYLREQWSNGSVAVERTRLDDETNYDTAPTQETAPQYGERLLTLFSALDPTVTRRTTESGDTVRVLRANASAAPDAIDARAVEDLRNVSLVAVVEPTGLVRRYRVTYEGVVDGQPVRVVEAVSFEDVGSTTVPRPDWVETAVQELADRTEDSEE